ncbi:GIY-YIG nuclease family protein [Leptolyngbya sp. GB1-A1]|uniref:GIY-YIG nuclease family protein n=1 Tax=Leptolyngbya sp. GB1-A1 TaxID=2933908 RepID=UPI003297EA54
MSEAEQMSLFEAMDSSTSRFVRQPKPLRISAIALQEWKQRIYEYQTQVRATPPQAEVNLFGEPIELPVADRLDPFTMRQQNIEFWRWKNSDQGTAALYFVIDYELPILLYVGETVKSGQRWKGEHGCKWYLDHYCSANSLHKIKTAIGIAFWSQAPAATRPRQQIESDLIYKWRSPFNKENWTFWGTPFVPLKQG